MQRTIIVPATNSQILPSLPIYFLYRMIFSGSKAKKPVSRRIGRNMHLIYPAYREGMTYSLMGSLHSIGILLIKRTFMLINHNAILMESLKAIAIELLGK